jgi:hypothetical protein
MTQIRLSKPYGTRDEAAMGGFQRILDNYQDCQFNEYAFWVILKPDHGKFNYHYCAPQTSGSRNHVNLIKPPGHPIRAYCHTHPQTPPAPDFSSGDLQQFRGLQKEQIVFYLMNGYREIRLAQFENDFMRGKSINWIKGVTP